MTRLTVQASASADLSTAAPVLQRACACGASKGVENQCRDCATKARLGVQPKLTVNRPGDRYEQEADRIADRVVAAGPPSSVSATAPTLQLETAKDEGEIQGKPAGLQRMEEDENELQMKPALQRMDEEEEELQRKPVLQRMEEDDELQTKASGPAPTSPAVAFAAAAVSGGGEPLSRAERSYFEPRLGRDLSAVRLHDNARARSAAKGINSHAYTHRNHIAFAPGTRDFASPEGRRLMAHELVHTVQQTHGGPVRLQRDCKNLQEKVRSRLVAQPRECIYNKNCCYELHGCDREGQVRKGVAAASNRLGLAYEQLDRPVLGRPLRRAKRQLLGRSVKKADIARIVADSRQWLKTSQIATPSKAQDSAMSTGDASGAGKAQARQGGAEPEVEPPSDDILETLPTPKERTTLQPPSVPGSPMTGGPGLLTAPQIDLQPRESECPRQSGWIRCGLTCSDSCESSNLLGNHFGGAITLCSAAFKTPEMIEFTLIHELMHEFLPGGGAADVYAFNRVFRVLPTLRGKDGKRGGIAADSPDAFAALIYVASGGGLDDFLELRGTGPDIEAEGILSPRRQRIAEAAFGLAEAGVSEASARVSNFAQALRYSTSSTVEEAGWAARALRDTGLVEAADGTNSEDREAAAAGAKATLERIEAASGGVTRLMHRPGTFGSSHLVGNTLKLPRRFFALRNQSAEARSIIEILVKADDGALVQAAGYSRFIHAAIGQHSGLKGLP